MLNYRKKDAPSQGEKRRDPHQLEGRARRDFEESVVDKILAVPKEDLPAPKARGTLVSIVGYLFAESCYGKPWSSVGYKRIANRSGISDDTAYRGMVDLEAIEVLWWPKDGDRRWIVFRGHPYAQAFLDEQGLDVTAGSGLSPRTKPAPERRPPRADGDLPHDAVGDRPDHPHDADNGRPGDEDGLPHDADDLPHDADGFPHDADGILEEKLVLEASSPTSTPSRPPSSTSATDQSPRPGEGLGGDGVVVVDGELQDPDDDVEVLGDRDDHPASGPGSAPDPGATGAGGTRRRPKKLPRRGAHPPVVVEGLGVAGGEEERVQPRSSAAQGGPLSPPGATGGAARGHDREEPRCTPRGGAIGAPDVESIHRGAGDALRGDKRPADAGGSGGAAYVAPPVGRATEYAHVLDRARVVFDHIVAAGLEWRKDEVTRYLGGRYDVLLLAVAYAEARGCYPTCERSFPVCNSSSDAVYVVCDLARDAARIRDGALAVTEEMREVLRRPPRPLPLPAAPHYRRAVNA